MKRLVYFPRYCQRSIVMLAVVMVLVTGCSKTDTSSGAYSSEFAAAIESTESEYVRKILDDGVITVEEYRDSHQQMLSCLNAAGISASYSDDYGLGYEDLITDALTDADFREIDRCSDKWIGEISTLYKNLIVNPKNEDLDTLIAACLVRKGLAPKGFSAADYEEMNDPYGVMVTINEGDPLLSGPIEGLEVSDPVLPSGIHMSDERAFMCVFAPLR